MGSGKLRRQFEASAGSDDEPQEKYKQGEQLVLSRQVSIMNVLNNNRLIR